MPAAAPLLSAIVALASEVVIVTLAAALRQELLAHGDYATIAEPRDAGELINRRCPLLSRVQGQGDGQRHP